MQRSFNYSRDALSETAPTCRRLLEPTEKSEPVAADVNGTGVPL